MKKFENKELFDLFFKDIDQIDKDEKNLIN